MQIQLPPLYLDNSKSIKQTITPVISNNKNSNVISNYYNSSFSFKGSQNLPLTDEDYQSALSNLPYEIFYAKQRNRFSYALQLNMLDLTKLNGLQKGIEVFDGLTLEEVGFALNNPTILLNRGCPNNCIHCAYMATPYSKKTLDRMSFEDFTSLLNGISELQSRVGNSVNVSPSIGTFLDSDCMQIELVDKKGKVYDYIDCLELIDELGIMPPLFDTSGWDKNSPKLQKRAEKFVDYISKPENKGKVRSVNISINPYHIIFAKSMDLRTNFKFRKAKELEKIYIERMANVLFTFSPIYDSDVTFEFLTRAISIKDSSSRCSSSSLNDIQDKILKALKKMYIQDLNGEQKVVKSKEQMDKYLKNFKSDIRGTEEISDIEPFGRAESLYKSAPSRAAIRTEQTINKVENSNFYGFITAINPNGSVILINDDIALKTDISLNFDNKDKQVKPFAHQVDNYIYKVGKVK